MKIHRASKFLILAVMAVIFSPGQGMCADNGSAAPVERARKLELRNRFLNSKFPHSSSAPRYQYEKLRQQRLDSKKG